MKKKCRPTYIIMGIATIFFNSSVVSSSFNSCTCIISALTFLLFTPNVARMRNLVNKSRMCIVSFLSSSANRCCFYSATEISKSSQNSKCTHFTVSIVCIISHYKIYHTTCWKLWLWSAVKVIQLVTIWKLYVILIINSWSVVPLSKEIDIPSPFIIETE